MSGYVSILFGRPRATDDIDVITEVELDELVGELGRCGSAPLTQASQDVFREAAVRFHKPPNVLPTLELKPPRSYAQRYALKHRVAVYFSGVVLYISPIELQIVYKLKPGSDKDVEDAVYLYSALRPYIKVEELNMWARALGADLSPLN